MIILYFGVSRFIHINTFSHHQGEIIGPNFMSIKGTCKLLTVYGNEMWHLALSTVKFARVVYSMAPNPKHFVAQYVVKNSQIINNSVGDRWWFRVSFYCISIFLILFNSKPVLITSHVHSWAEYQQKWMVISLVYEMSRMSLTENYLEFINRTCHHCW